MRCRITVLFSLSLLVGAAQASPLDDMVAALGGNDDRARSLARQLIVREDPVAATSKVLPLLASEKAEVWTAAFNVLADITSEVGVAGRETQRTAVTRELMSLVATDQPEQIKLRGLRLLLRAVPAGYDVAPVARLLADEKLREKALAALEEMRTPQACAAIRDRLAKADPKFQCALLNSLAVLRDKESVTACEPLLHSDDTKVRAAAIRSIAWTGDSNFIKECAGIVRSADDTTRSDTHDAFLRLLNAVAEKGDRQIALKSFLEMLESRGQRTKQAGLAGLGRYGDGSCVTPILNAINDTDPRTWAIGINALRTIGGADTVRAIVTAYPNSPSRTQLALISVLGAKRDALAAPILKEAAESSDPAFRQAALEAIADAPLPQTADILLKIASGENKEQRAIACRGLLLLAGTLRGEGKKEKAGQLYLRTLSVAGDDGVIRRNAVEGLLTCPVPDAYEAGKAFAADKNSGELGTRLLLAVASALTGANQKEKALELYDFITHRNPDMNLMREVASGMIAAGAKVDTQRLLGVITTWWVVGPFDLGEKQEGWNVDYISESTVSLAAKYMSGKRRLNWTQLTSKDPNGKIDLRATVANSDNCIGYAYTEVTVKEAADALLLLGVDDSERIWINGQKVFEQFVPRGLTPDQDKVPIHLSAGKNTILLKIWQNTLGWEFCARLTTPDGRPLPFSQVD